MRIYNAKKSTIDVPLGNQRIVVKPNSISQDFMPSVDFLKMMSVTFDEKEVALIVGGAWEGNMCATIPALQAICVGSIDEAIARFNPAPKPAETKVEAPQPKKEPEKPKAPEEMEMPKEELEEVEEPKKEEAPKAEVVTPEAEILKDEEKPVEEESAPEPKKKTTRKGGKKKKATS